MPVFAVIRHPEAGVGTCPESAIEDHRGRGWVRVSEWRSEPSDFHLPDFAEATKDLDEPVPTPVPAKTTKETKA